MKFWWELEKSILWQWKRFLGLTVTCWSEKSALVNSAAFQASLLDSHVQQGPMRALLSTSICCSRMAAPFLTSLLQVSIDYSDDGSILSQAQNEPRLSCAFVNPPPFHHCLLEAPLSLPVQMHCIPEIYHDAPLSIFSDSPPSLGALHCSTVRSAGGISLQQGANNLTERFTAWLQWNSGQ